MGKKKHKRESLFSQNSSNNERTKKLTEEKESEILTERDMKLRTRDDESVFVLLLRVVSSIFCPLFVSGGGCCRCCVVFFAFEKSSKAHLLENQYTYIEFTRAFSLSPTLSLSKRTATRSSLFEELKEADLFHSGEKRRIKRRERDTFKAAQSSEGNLKFSRLWVTNSFTIHRRDGDTR